MSTAASKLRTFVANNEIPVGYHTPSFPSLYWPISNESYSLAFLYNIEDIWKFTMYWCLILNGAFYGTSGLVATISHWKNPHAILIVGLYLLYAGIQGVVIGIIAGLLLGAIYRAGLFTMSTWIPLCCAVAQILFDVVMSYSHVGSLL
ncbi:May24p KNAG_0A07980 [Huiozyma naganishii CBS 8797]|uniref:Uncharacterized protein n=1 Tax=Huiozyma naganishii (strain ATCC MYA-139 / BCRC 22969 / CBS 8797 / KCTC 17520 / NBRC 10181 / NCYC 3082 / Yp74L-3) TaxID=1071383 RepID=J7S494_HUIN7|nr:hypothetical protein KNAG_0A07980 [Kazachstania naganishii CBS 8797]CCK68451.1 hypothetical protein KNAG_0A07980 [Kazachstania naganishii CBS 8797]